MNCHPFRKFIENYTAVANEEWQVIEQECQ